MKLLPTQTDGGSLSAFGEEACAMLVQHDNSGLTNRFGYALAYDRAPATAIETDFLSAVASPYNVVSGAHPSIVVKYLAPNDTGLFAVVECTVPVVDEAAVRLALIVTGKGEEKHITLEDINGVAA